jgi:exodeoxyribonuclease III
MRTVRIATWNINGLRARLEFLCHWLRDRQPDIVGLQELKLEDEHFPHDVFAELGYRALIHGQKAWNGVAILSREPAILTACGLAGQESVGARLLEGRIGDLRFATVYCPNGRSVGNPEFAQKLLWLDALLEWVEHQPRDDAAILCGDFNLCPAPIDSWNEARFAGQIFHTAEERQRFQRLLSGGLRDLLREHAPDLQTFSWWDYRAGSFHKNEGLRIDLVLGTPAVAARLKSVRVDRDYRKKQQGLTPSDHAPVIAELS